MERKSRKSNCPLLWTFLFLFLSPIPSLTAPSLSMDDERQFPDSFLFSFSVPSRTLVRSLPKLAIPTLIVSLDLSPLLRINRFQLLKLDTQVECAFKFSMFPTDLIFTYTNIGILTKKKSTTISKFESLKYDYFQYGALNFNA